MEENEKVTLINKLVRVVNPSDGIDNSGIIPFMYPSFLLKDDIFFDHENDIIFTGKNKQGLRAELEHGTKSFIALISSGIYDVDFTNRETIIKVLYSKWNKSPSTEVLELLTAMTENDFWDFFKKFWILGTSKFDNDKHSVFNLYKVLGKQRHDILKTYFDLRDVYEDSMIFSSVLSFLEKALNPDQVSDQKGRYTRILNAFAGDYSESISKIINSIYPIKATTPAEKEYRTFCLLMYLGKGNMI